MSDHNYLFDVKIFTSVRVDADNEEEAREKLATFLDCCNLNFGEIAEGINCSSGSMDGEADLMEVDGEDPYVNWEKQQ